MTTTYSNKANILAEVWLDYRDDEDFKDFVAYNDLGLPLSYALSYGIIENNNLVEKFVEETFSLLLAGLGIKEDIGFEVLNDLFQEQADD